MKVALIITGVLAGLAVAVPHLVVLGFFCLIIPGLILALTPTVFVYLAATSLIRFLLFRSTEVSATLAALAISLGIGWAVMQPQRIVQAQRFTAELLPEVTPVAEIKLRGNVFLDWSQSDFRNNEEIACDHLCAALLATPGVESVTLLPGDSNPKLSGTFRLIPAKANDAMGFSPDEPAKILQAFIKRDRRLNEDPPLKFEEIKSRRAGIEAHWALRLAKEERIILEPALAAEHADWTICYVKQTNKSAPTIHRLEILNRAQSVNLRRSFVQHRIPASFFHFGFQGGSAAGGFQGARFHLATRQLSEGDRNVKYEPEVELLEHVLIAPPQGDAQTVGELRLAVEEMLKNPTATTAEAHLATKWLNQFWFNTTPADIALIEKILLDQRVRDVAPALKNAFPKSTVPLELRHAFGQRIRLAHTSPSDRGYFAASLAEMPTGTFQHPTATERAIWADPAIRLEAAPFIARIADQGGAATPHLVEILQDALEISPWNNRRQIIEALREGFVRLGPAGADAIPTIREIFLRRPSPIMNTSKDAHQWRVALARMGLPLDQSPFFPNQNDSMQERERKSVEQALARLQDNNCK